MLPNSHWLASLLKQAPLFSTPIQARTLRPPSPPLLLVLSGLLIFFSKFWPKSKLCNKMMQTLHLYNTAKTAEIMARYRPIAPKPEDPTNPNGDNNSSLPEGIRRSPYLMNVWNHMQARPTRTRKRGRTALAPPIMKRTRTCLQGLSPPYQVTTSPAKILALQGFVHDPCGTPSLSFIPNLVPLKCGFHTPVTTSSNRVSLPLVPCNPAVSLPTNANALQSIVGGDGEGSIDLNKAAEAHDEVVFIPQLEMEEGSGTNPTTKFAVVKPQAIKLVVSSISVGKIIEDHGAENKGKQVVMKEEDVEKKIESEVLPALVSDSKNKVRLTNAAYNEMIGQPECLWLDLVPPSCGSGRDGGACKRIGGEVVLDFVNCSLPKSSNGFTCWVRIEWGKDGKKNVVNAFCEGMPLACESKDYLFEWRFHIAKASESASNV